MLSLLSIVGNEGHRFCLGQTQGWKGDELWSWGEVNQTNSLEKNMATPQVNDHKYESFVANNVILALL